LVVIVSRDRRVYDASSEGANVEIDRVVVVVESSEVTEVGAPRAPKRGEATYLTAATEQVHPDQLLRDTNRPFLFRKDFGIQRPFLIWSQQRARSYWVMRAGIREVLSGCSASAAPIRPVDLVLHPTS